MLDGDDDAVPNAATGWEAQAMEKHAAEDIKHILKACLGALRPPRWGESGARGDCAF